MTERCDFCYRKFDYDCNEHPTLTLDGIVVLRWWDIGNNTRAYLCAECEKERFAEGKFIRK